MVYFATFWVPRRTQRARYLGRGSMCFRSLEKTLQHYILAQRLWANYIQLCSLSLSSRGQHGLSYYSQIQIHLLSSEGPYLVIRHPWKTVDVIRWRLVLYFPDTEFHTFFFGQVPISSDIHVIRTFPDMSGARLSCRSWPYCSLWLFP